MKTIAIFEKAGAFAENKDVARDLRIRELLPALERGDDVVLDFTGVEAATQSFVHALISETFRRYGPEVLERMSFKGCGDTVKRMIRIVSDYMQEGMGIETDRTDTPDE